MAKKIRVGILFGGRSTEHEVSIRSAKNVIDVIDRKKFAPVLIGIDNQGTVILLSAGSRDLLPSAFAHRHTGGGILAALDIAYGHACLLMQLFASGLYRRSDAITRPAMPMRYLFFSTIFTMSSWK